MNILGPVPYTVYTWHHTSARLHSTLDNFCFATHGSDALYDARNLTVIDAALTSLGHTSNILSNLD